MQPITCVLLTPRRSGRVPRREERASTNTPSAPSSMKETAKRYITIGMRSRENMLKSILCAKRSSRTMRSALSPRHSANVPRSAPAFCMLIPAVCCTIASEPSRAFPNPIAAESANTACEAAIEETSAR